MKRTSLRAARCPVARALDVIGDWWSLLIVRDALSGVRRFGEFQKSLGVARNILAARLKNLTASGILKPVPAADGSGYNEYVPTAKGEALLPVLVALGQWGGEHLFAPGEKRAGAVDAARGRPLRRLEVRAEDGRRLTPREVAITGTAGKFPS